MVFEGQSVGCGEVMSGKKRRRKHWWTVGAALVWVWEKGSRDEEVGKERDGWRMMAHVRAGGEVRNGVTRSIRFCRRVKRHRDQEVAMEFFSHRWMDGGTQ